MSWTVIDELKKNVYWEDTYNKMVLKKTMTPAEKNELWRIKDILKDEIIEQLANDTYKWSIPKRLRLQRE